MQQCCLETDDVGPLRRAAMKRMRMEPNTRSFNALMSACERGGEPDRALEVFRKIERSAQQPTAVTYNTLLSALGKAGRCA